MTTVSNYLLPNDEKERIRLSEQHELYTKTVYDGHLIYDRTVKLSHGSQVIDIGTGTGAWIMDLAKHTQENVEFIGIDISTRLFPVNPPPNVKFYEMSALKLPEDWTGRFDFVNARLLILGLLKDDWTVFLSELFRILKPGGSVQLCEGSTDSVHQAPLGEKFENLLRQSFIATGHDHECAIQLGTKLFQCGFVNVRSDPRRFPVGKIAGKYGIMGTENMAGACRPLKKHILKLGLADTEEKVDKLVDDMVAEWDKGDEPKYRIVYLARAVKPGVN